MLAHVLKKLDNRRNGTDGIGIDMQGMVALRKLLLADLIDVFDRLHSRLSHWQYFFAKGREVGAAARTEKERLIKFVFQGADGIAQGGFANKEIFRRLRQRIALGNL